MTEPKPIPEQNLPGSPNSEENTSPPKKRATGFFNRFQREIKPEPIHPSERDEIVVDPETLK
jgi:hypothetical protein